MWWLDWSTINSLYEKSPVERDFINKFVKNIGIKCNIEENVYNSNKIDSDYFVSRAFKKLPEILRISREIIKKPHKMIILKGKNAQQEINTVLKDQKFDYKLINSITKDDSKIIIVKFTKKWRQILYQ